MVRERLENNMSKTPAISINGRQIGSGFPPYIIAEVSANHNGSVDVARRLVEEAARAGASAVKLQTYTPDTITLDCDSEDFVISSGLWAGRTLYELYGEAHMPWEWQVDLFEYAKKIGITLFSSPFDSTAIDFLEDLGAPAYKIASFEAIDLPLISYAATTGKPMIISTGMATEEEIAEAVTTALESGCQQVALLHCVSGYPAPVEDYHLQTIPDMINKHGLVTGLSDHTIGNVTAITSIALGASIVEKHFTLDHNGGGPDDSFSMEPHQLKNLCEDCSAAWISMGTSNYQRKNSETDNVRFRRSLYFIESLKRGDVITEGSIKSVRPGFGLAPKYIETVIGKRLACDVEYGRPVTAECLE